MLRSSRAGLTLTLTALLVAGASASASAQAQATTPNRELAKLQTQLAANPSSVKALFAVGYKLYELNRIPEARPVLEQARQLDPKCGQCALFAGLAAEKVMDYTAAKAAYTKYLEVGKTKDAKEKIRSRLLAMAKDELTQSAKQAVANEVALRGAQAPGNTVAVLPFKCSCADTTLLPLERGMAELVVTDLSRSSNLRVLERERMQAIADEISLSRGAQVDAATATRAGKLIAAGRILNGQILAPSGQQINLTSAVVNTNTTVVESNPAAAGTMNAIFDIEKTFVLDVFTKLGIALSPAERKEFDKRPTQNLQAFLAFSRGLMAQDAGRLDDAAKFFESARSLDPGFGAALQRAQSAAAAQNSAAISAAKIEQGLKNTAEGNVVAAAHNGSTSDATLGTTLNTVVGDVNPTTTNTVQNSTGGTGGSAGTPQQQNTVAQTTGSDQPAVRTGQLTIVIKKP